MAELLLFIIGLGCLFTGNFLFALVFFILSHYQGKLK